MVRIPTAILCLPLLTVFGCSLFDGDDPFAGFSIGQVDETTEQSPAAILLGDPQVISRETLINDRLREVKHLDEMIEESRDDIFTPQLRRDLSVIKTFAFQLGISFNPGAGSAFNRAEEVADLKADIEIEQLRQELEALKQRSEFVPAEGGKNGKDPSGGIPAPSDQDIKDQLDEVIERAKATLDALQKDGVIGSRARAAEITASPEERFEDLNAHRARLRQRQAEVALDDVHDKDGNTLYRLQFTATVLPGGVKNKYGVLDIAVRPPRIGDAALDQLYEDWLRSLMVRASEERTNVNAFEWERVQTELLQAKLVERVLLTCIPGEDGTPGSLVLFTYTGHSDPVIKMSQGQFGQIAEGIMSSPLSEELFSGLTLTDTECSLASQWETVSDLYTEARQYVGTVKSLSAIEVFLSTVIRKTRAESQAKADAEDRKWGGSPSADHLQQYLDELFRNISSAKKLIGRVQDRLNTIPARCAAGVAPGTVPDIFKDQLAPTEGAHRIGDGDIRTYQAQPTHKVQRLSTLASAVNSMQAAFSLAATLPAQGIGLQAGAGASRNAVGMAEAIERTPIIIGFTDRRAGDTGAGFGYVFGPRAILDPAENQLRYRHIPASYSVFAEISVPAWWPSVSLEIRTAWAKNWHDGKGVLDDRMAARTVEVSLSPKAVDIDDLTKILTRKAGLFGGADEVGIKSVRPSTVSACAGEVEFLIEGTGKSLWRGARVFLRGKRHQDIAVLPDLKGVSAVFDIGRLPPRPRADASDRLVVWSSAGPTEADITIVAPPDGRGCGGPTVPSASLAVAHARSRFVDGATKKVVVDYVPPIAEAIHDIKVAARVRIPGLAKPFPIAESGAPTWMPGRSFEGTFASALAPTNIADAAFAGATVEVGLSYLVGGDSQRRHSWAAGPIPFYASAPKIVPQTEAVKSLPATVWLTLPRAFNAVFPDLRQETGVFAATTGHAGISITVKAAWDRAPGKARLRLAVSDKKATEAEKTAFLTAQCGGDLPITLSVLGDAGPDLPTLDPATVTLQRRTTGCPTS